MLYLFINIATGIYSHDLIDLIYTYSTDVSEYYEAYCDRWRVPESNPPSHYFNLPLLMCINQMKCTVRELMNRSFLRLCGVNNHMIQQWSSKVLTGVKTIFETENSCNTHSHRIGLQILSKPFRCRVECVIIDNHAEESQVIKKKNELYALIERFQLR
jgi:hypothetical protein